MRAPLLSICDNRVEHATLEQALRAVPVPRSYCRHVDFYGYVCRTFKIDPAKKPKETDAAYTEGPDKGKSFKGTYQLDGDTLKFCRAGSPDQKRPTEFKTKADTGGIASVYKRAKP